MNETGFSENKQNELAMRIKNCKLHILIPTYSENKTVFVICFYATNKFNLKMIMRILFTYNFPACCILL